MQLSATLIESRSNLVVYALIIVLLGTTILSWDIRIVKAASSSTVSTKIAITTEDNDDDDISTTKLGTFSFNISIVLRILGQLNYLGLYLNQASETNNSLVRFLLHHQHVCPLQLFIGSDGNVTGSRPPLVELKKFYVPQRHRAVLIRGANLRNAFAQYASRTGVLILIIADELSEADILQSAYSFWQQRGIYKVYYFTRTNCWFYNPFARRNNNEFGALIDADQSNLEGAFRNMNGYPIRAYIFDSVYSSVYGDVKQKKITKILGADSEAAMLMGKKLNFTLQLQWPDDEFFGARLANGSYNGALGRIIRYETDVIWTGFFVKDYLTREIVFTVSVYMDELCCYVAKAKRIPQSILPLFAVHVDIWFGFFLVGMLSPIIWMLMRYLNLYLKSPDNIDAATLTHLQSITLHSDSCFISPSYYQYARIFIDTWVLWVRVNILHFPPFYSERIFVASLCLMSVIYGALFESSLATVYIRPLYYKDINTMQELDDAGFRIYIKHAAMKDDLFYGHSSLVYQHLDRKVLLVAETEERLISMMSKRGGFGAVTRASSLVLDDIRYFITNKIHKIPECPKTYHIAFVLPRQSPYEETFNIWLLRFLEAGLIDQWIDVMKHKAKIKIHTYPDYKAESGNQWKVLTLKDLQLAFYALAFGCTFAFLSFVGEFVLGLRLKFCFRAINRATIKD